MSAVRITPTLVTGSGVASRWIRSALQAVAAFARKVVAREVQLRRARATYEALSRLDDRTLRDLGLDRSELCSIGMEFATNHSHTRRLGRKSRA